MKAVFEHIEKYGMLPAGSVVYAAVSGGKDSMCMLHLLLSVREKYSITVKALHYNHMLRGDESDRDELFVKDMCEKWGVELICGRGDVNARAEEAGIGTEQAAREMRYEFFSSAVEDGALVATAHTADDNLETVLLNLIRGTALTGLAGIPPVRGRFIRPILPMTSENVEEYLKKHAVAHREDSTNALDIYSRNLLRHKVIPVLREINPSAAENALRSAEIIRRDDSFLDREAAGFIAQHLYGGKTDASALRGLDPALSGRVIKALCPGADAGHIKAVLDLCGDDVSPSAELSLPGQTVKREYGKIVFSSENEPEEWDGFSLVPGEKFVIAPLGLYVYTEECVFDGIVDKSFTIFVFKSADICGRISVRPRTTGDSIRLPGGNKTLKKLYIEKKIPSGKRSSLPVLSDDGGVLAVYGLCAGERCRPEKGDRIIKIRFGEIDQK